MAGDIGFTQAMLVSLFIQTLLYGMNTVLFFMCIYVLIYGKGKSKGKPINKPLLITAIVLYTLCSAHVINDFGRGITGFISYQTSPTNPEGPAAFYEQLWNWSGILRHATYVTNNAVADSLLVYRLYVVWNFNYKVIILPAMILLTTIACGYRAVWGFSDLTKGQDTYAADIYTWGVSLLSLSLLLNLTVTGLIAGRIWWCGRQTAIMLGHSHSRKYSRALVVIVESGAIYFASVVVSLITYAAKANAIYVAYDVSAQIMVMNPILIIVRCGLGLTLNDQTVKTTKNTDVRLGSGSVGRRTDSYGLAMQVHKEATQTKGDEASRSPEQMDDTSRSGWM